MARYADAAVKEEYEDPAADEEHADAFYLAGAYYVVVDRANPGIYETRPPGIALGKHIDLLPIVIVCRDKTMAEQVYRLNDILQDIEGPDNANVLRNAFANSPYVKRHFMQPFEHKFYAMKVATQTGIYYGFDWAVYVRPLTRCKMAEYRGFHMLGNTLVWMLEKRHLQPVFKESGESSAGRGALRVTSPPIPSDAPTPGDGPHAVDGPTVQSLRAPPNSPQKARTRLPAPDFANVNTKMRSPAGPALPIKTSASRPASPVKMSTSRPGSPVKRSGSPVKIGSSMPFTPSTIPGPPLSPRNLQGNFPPLASPSFAQVRRVSPTRAYDEYAQTSRDMYSVHVSDDESEAGTEDDPPHSIFHQLRRIIRPASSLPASDMIHQLMYS
ncbi:hypothetical protein C2E23DRAFT_883154 [Lenzites betulinus]|nr:hypothetical protein C2E23DRAFT_883154 [Lenzites betulinus]